MAKPEFQFSRRHALTMLGGGALAAAVGSKAWAQTPGTPTLLMDGHVHVTNRVYWEKADLWQPRDAGSACSTRRKPDPSTSRNRFRMRDQR
jgi:hypothetical protein